MNAISRRPAHTQLSTLTVEALRERRDSRCCCDDCLFEDFLGEKRLFEKRFGCVVTIACWKFKCLELETSNAGLSPNGGLSLYADSRDDDMPSEVSLDLLHAALCFMEQCVNDEDDSLFRSRSAFLFVSDDRSDQIDPEDTIFEF